MSLTLLKARVEDERGYEPIWEYEAPRMDECCMCFLTKHPGSAWVIESRPTGPKGKMQEWGWCVPCAVAFKDSPIHSEGLGNFLRHYREEIGV
jgi:hypothetical protein